MGALEDVTQMKQQGMSESEIVNTLQERGISPKEINDALSQSQIKNAVSRNMQNTPSPTYEQDSTLSLQNSQTPYIPRIQESNNFQEQELYVPQPQQEYFPQEQVYQESDYDSYPATEGNYTDTMIEIAEQVFSKKTEKMQKQIEELNEFKTLAQTKIETISERLKRIETTIDRLQISILDRIGSYGKNLDNIKKEMSMMQDSFGKVVNQAVRGHATPVPKKTTHTKRKTSKKK